VKILAKVEADSSLSTRDLVRIREARRLERAVAWHEFNE